MLGSTSDVEPAFKKKGTTGLCGHGNPNQCFLSDLYRFLGHLLDSLLVRYLILNFILSQQGFEPYSLVHCFV